MVLILGGFAVIKFRERIADMIGVAEWMRYFGGVYMFVSIIGILMFIFGIARLTGTTDIMLSPLYWLIPKPGTPPPPSF